MAIVSVIPVLHCLCIEQTLNFYQQLLHFVVVNKRQKNGELAWVHLMHGETTLMLQTSSGISTNAKATNDVLSNNAQATIELYFFVDNIKELHHFIKAKYNNISKLSSSTYQTQEFYLTDPEGNVVTLGMLADKI